MGNGMTGPKVKLAISMSPALLAKVKSVVSRKRSKSVSAYIEHAVAAQLAAETDFDLLVAQRLDETGGPPTQAERARARKLLRGAA
jgi:hypothetical protein